MAAVTELDLMREGALQHLPMPFVWRPPVSMSDKELMAFSRLHRPYRIERNACGDLEIMSPLNLKGAKLETWVIASLSAWAETNGGVAFSSNAGFTLPDTSVRSPDASWLSKQTWDALGDEQESFGHVAPEFLIEVLSKSDSRSVLEAKMQLWMASGTLLGWMIDPFAREVCVYRVDGEVGILPAPEVVVADAVVPGFRLDMQKFWG